MDLAKAGLTILIENTAGAEFSLGGSFEQVAEVLEYLRDLVPVGACIDTCHTHVAGYDIVSPRGMGDTLTRLDETVGLKNVRVWHCNDAKAAARFEARPSSTYRAGKLSDWSPSAGC